MRDAPGFYRSSGCLAKGAAAFHGDQDSCATQAGDNTDQGASCRTLSSLIVLAHGEEPMRTFDCDVDIGDRESMKDNPDALGENCMGRGLPQNLSWSGESRADCVAD
ncbi:unnamed protein product [Symbiodinium sp. CCMP2456]|nr:unnamed protein product [Symbiodinium sp. CCMP2456]